MIIKRYIANTLQEAKILIEEELGSEAILLTTRHLKETGIKSLFGTSKIEVTAAIEEEDLKTYQNKKGKSSLMEETEKKDPSDVKEGLNHKLHDLKKLVNNLSEDPSLKSSKEVEKKEDFKQKEANFLAKPSQEIRGDMQKKEALSDDTLDLSREALMVQKGKVPQKPSDVQVETYSYMGKKSQKQVDGQKDLPSVQEKVNTEISVQSTHNKTQSSDQTQSLDQAHQRVLSVGRRIVENFEKEKKSQKQRSSSTGKPDKKNDAGKMGVDLEELRMMIRQEMQQAQYRIPIQEETSDDASLFKKDVAFLISKGLSRSLAMDIERDLDQRFGYVDMSVDSTQRVQRLNALKHNLAGLVITGNPIRLRGSQASYVALVGSTGVGKTSTVIKIASLYAEKLGKQVAILSFDPEKRGSVEQISSYADELEIPCKRVCNLEELKKTAKLYSQKDLVLIDTAGRSQYCLSEMDELQEMIKSFESLDIYLTLSATTKDVDTYGTIGQFSRLDIRGLIFTKLDESISHGILINVCQKTKKPISYLSNGKSIPEDFMVADPHKISKGLLVQNNDSQYQWIRRIANA